MHGKNLVTIKQLVDGLHGQRHLILRVFYNVTDFSAMNAAFGVHFLKHHARQLGGIDAPNSSRAAQRRMRADDNLVIANPLLRLRRRQSHPGNSCSSNHVFQETELHFCLPIHLHAHC